MLCEKFVKRRSITTDILISEISLLDRIYRARNIQSHKFIDYQLKNLLLPETLLNIDVAINLLISALHQQQKITIIGDFDTDGATSTALATKCLKMFGYKNVNYIIPDRFNQGYGLSTSIAQQLLSDKTAVVITVDNGISSIDAIDLLKKNNITTIITDHHVPPSTLPNADAIINPNLTNCSFPSKNLAGVGVIFYVMWHLRNKLKLSYPKQEFPSLISVLDLVALGTIADLVALDYNNRILVQQGLNIIKQGKGCSGINALFKVTKENINYTKITTNDLSFSIAPRLNAAGRLDDMSIGVELLLTQDQQKATKIAKKLDALNISRKEIELTMKNEAINLCQKLKLHENAPLGIVVYDKAWHQGIIGLVSAKLKDYFYRPAITFAPDKNGIIKGSARSINGVHIKNILTEIDILQPDLLISFGGHAMAAGLSIAENRLDEFKQTFNKLLLTKINKDLLANIIYTDGELQIEEYSLDVAYALKTAGPWGQNFPEPLFDGYFKIVQKKIIAERHLKMIVQPIINGQLKNMYIDAIAFNFNADIQHPDTSYLVYTVDVNEYNNQEKVQLLVRELNSASLQLN